MSVSRLCDAEFEALMGLPHEARTLYCEGLRPFLDYASGRVGESRRVAYQGFYELLEVNTERGSTVKPYRADESIVRYLLAQLRQAGLLTPVYVRGKTVPLVFTLPLADVVVRGATVRYINDEELVALRGVPHEVRTLYREGLRSAMCRETGIAGDDGRLQYQQFEPLLVVAPGRGRRAGQAPSVKRIRCHIALLERRGLIEKLPNKPFEALRFRLVFGLAGLVCFGEEGQLRGMGRGSTKRHESHV